MTLAGMLAQTATVFTFTLGDEDDYGNAAETWVEGASYPCRLEPTSGQERTVDRDTQVSDWRLFLPADAELTGRDRVVVDSKVFEVVGPPAVQHTPRGPHHVEAALRYVEGG